VVLADAERGDWILCQVTSKSYADSAAVALEPADFRRGIAAVVKILAGSR
jgi:mRNA interferase MazF